MRHIEIKKELGERTITRTDGAKLRKLVEQALNDPPVIIDFGDRQVTSFSFFDEAFGAIVLEHGKGALEHIKLERIDRFDRALFDDIVASRLRDSKKAAVS
jgi:hypothetical protein